MAGVARRVLDRAAAPADLQLEAAFGGGRRHAERGAAALLDGGRFIWRVRSTGFFLRGGMSGIAHGARSRITAPVHRHRSYVTIPNPETSPSFASFTARSPASSVS